jgi:ABC-type lipoprotein release transport system permease subunit
MTEGKLLALVCRNIVRQKRNFVFSCVGILVGVGMFSFFVALGDGIQEGVINRIYPINQIEVEPASVDLFGAKKSVHELTLNKDKIAEFQALPDVIGVYPKQRSKFQGRLWGGKGIFGRDLRTEAFFDGISPEIVLAEIRENEMGRVDEAPQQKPRKRRKLPCRRDSECGAAQECRKDVCEDIQFFTLFRDFGEVVTCSSSQQCLPGAACLNHRCYPSTCDPGELYSCGGSQLCVQHGCRVDEDCGGDADSCVDGSCLLGHCGDKCAVGGGMSNQKAVPFESTCGTTGWCVGISCAVDGDCPGGGCVQGRCDVLATCEPVPCALNTSKEQLSNIPDVFRGTVPGVCGDGTFQKEGMPCELPLRCSERAYCAPVSVIATDGFCERRVPVLLSPFLVEMFNSTAATALGLQPISETKTLLGMQFRLQYGDSYFSRGVEKDAQVVKRAEIVGFSDKALDLGVTMPLPYVQRANARYRGTGEAGLFDSVIMVTEKNESVHGVTRAVEEMGFVLSRKSQDAKKASEMLYVLTLVFILISWVIMTIAAVNISHTFLMVIYERKRELGVLRSIGATRMDIRKIVLVEAFFIGVIGGCLGNGAALLVSLGIDAGAAVVLADMPFKPDSFFVFQWGLMGISISMAVIFCVLGAWAPSNRAAKLDPAVILTEA